MLKKLFYLWLITQLQNCWIVYLNINWLLFPIPILFFNLNDDFVNENGHFKLFLRVSSSSSLIYGWIVDFNDCLFFSFCFCLVFACEKKHLQHLHVTTYCTSLLSDSISSSWFDHLFFHSSPQHIWLPNILTTTTKLCCLCQTH